jgi:hypothetical protein
MNDIPKEPIDLLKRREEKLLEKERRKAQDEGAQRQLEWPGSRFQEEAESIQLSEDLLDRVKIMMCVVASHVMDATSIHEIKRSCFGLALLLLKENHQEAYEKLLEMVKQDQGGD